MENDKDEMEVVHETGSAVLDLPAANDEDEMEVVYEKCTAVPDPPVKKLPRKVPRLPQGDAGVLLESNHRRTSQALDPLESFTDWQFSTPKALADMWLDAHEFVATRYGLREISQVQTDDKRLWNKKLGLKPGEVYRDLVELYTSVVVRGCWPSGCDLSDTAPVPRTFPSRNPASVLALTMTNLGYVIEVQDGVVRRWKLLIKDPLTVLQIEREGWCSDGGKLVVNLVLRGIPFEVLHRDIVCDWRPFHPHPGPVIHPDGQDPLRVDYFVCRHELARFLIEYPHAKAAALCAGGILWRLALDVFEVPSEAEIVVPFHESACTSRMIDGEKYWTPHLLGQDENVLVGVYRWAVGKPKNGVNFTGCLLTFHRFQQQR